MPATYSDRLQGLTTSVAVKAPCRVATTEDIVLSGLQIVGGIQLIAHDRVLVKSQASAVDNGIWVAGPRAWSRALDFNGARDAVPGTVVYVLEGLLARQAFMADGVSADSFMIGVDEVTFSENVYASLYRTSLAFATYVQLAAITGTIEGQSAVVFGDAGSHTDPVVGGTVDNEGVYGWSMAEEGWQRLSNLEAADAGASAALAQSYSDLSYHYANDDTNTDVVGGIVGSRGAKYWSELLGAQLENIFARLDALESGVPIDFPSLDFSDERNSQYLPCL